jgi:hypothetical protein
MSLQETTAGAAYAAGLVIATELDDHTYYHHKLLVDGALLS